MDLGRPLTDRHKFANKFDVEPSRKTDLRNFLPTPKNWAGETSHFAELSPTLRQSEARNFKVAQHIDKQIPDISSTINALQNGIKIGGNTHGLLMQAREKIDKI